MASKMDQKYDKASMRAGVENTDVRDGITDGRRCSRIQIDGVVSHTAPTVSIDWKTNSAFEKTKETRRSRFTHVVIGDDVRLTNGFEDFPSTINTA